MVSTLVWLLCLEGSGKREVILTIPKVCYPRCKKTVTVSIKVKFDLSGKILAYDNDCPL